MCVFLSEKDVLSFQKEHKKRLAFYTDEVFNRTWILDLTNFTHPEGVGPSKYEFNKLRDITDRFNRAMHNNDSLERLLMFSIGVMRERAFSLVL